MAARKTKNEDNLITKLLVWVLGDAGRSKKVRVFLVQLLTMGLTALAAKWEFVNPEWAEKLADLIFWGGNLVIGKQGLTDVLSGGKTSANFKG